MIFSDRQFRIGIFLQLTGIGLLLLTHNTYAAFFTFFLFVTLLMLGCIATLTSKASKRNRIIFSLWPVFLLILVVPAVYIQSWWLEYRDMSRYEPETYLIPNGFEGCIGIRFGYPQGETTRYVNGRREYVLPLHGILITNTTAQVNQSPLGTVIEKQEAMREYYYIEGDKRTRLPVVTQETIDSTSTSLAVYVIYEGTDFIIAPQRDFPKYWIGNYAYKNRLDSLEQILVNSLPAR